MDRSLAHGRDFLPANGEIPSPARLPLPAVRNLTTGEIMEGRDTHIILASKAGWEDYECGYTVTGADQPWA